VPGGRRAIARPTFIIPHSPFSIPNWAFSIQHSQFRIPMLLPDRRRMPKGILLPITVVGNVAVVHVQGADDQRGGFVASLCDSLPRCGSVLPSRLRSPTTRSRPSCCASLAGRVGRRARRTRRRDLRRPRGQADCGPGGRDDGQRRLPGPVSQADAVFAQRMDLIGSIGTRLLLYDWVGLLRGGGGQGDSHRLGRPPTGRSRARRPGHADHRRPGRRFQRDRWMHSSPTSAPRCSAGEE
jgi:hypothetical protein